MKKIYNMDHVTKLNFYPSVVIGRISEFICILNYNYGCKRDVYKDLGGYALILEDENDVEEIKKNILKGIIPEYIDNIECEEGKRYCLSLFLLSSDYAVIVVATKELMDILIEE